MKKNKVLAGICFIAVVALILSGVYVLRFSDGRTPPVSSSASVSASQHEVDHYTPSVDRTNGEVMAAAVEVNEDVKGWLEIAGTDIYAPVLQADNNIFYQSHNWKGEEDTAGAYYFDSACDVRFFDLLSPNVIIYGRNTDTRGEDVGDGINFNQLARYLDKGFFDKNQTILLTIADFEMPYEVFSVGYIDADTEALITKANPTPDDFQELLALVVSVNVFGAEVSTEGIINIITLIAYDEESAQHLAVFGKLAL